MQAKANEPRVSIERIFSKSARFMPTPFSEVTAIFSNFRGRAPNPSLFIITSITSNLFAQNPFQFAFGGINLLRSAR